MTLVRYALDRFRRMYQADPELGVSEMVDYVVHNAVLPEGGDAHELINWYETRAAELRRAMAVGARVDTVACPNCGTEVPLLV